MGLAYAVITVAVNILAGVAVVKVDVGWTVRVGASAKFWQITRVTGFTTRSTRWLQLHTNVDSKTHEERVKLRRICSDPE